MMTAPAITARGPIILFKRTALDPPAELSPGESTRSETRNRKKKALLCKFCGHEITTRSKAFPVGGSHIHEYKNPAGIVYRIGCFTAAKGCVIAGEPTAEDTWFPGFAWCYALCGQCVAHLGWHYGSGGRGFFGLILENLVEH